MGQIDLRQALAIFENIIRKRCHTFGNGNALQFLTTAEFAVPQDGQRRGQLHRLYILRIHQCIGRNVFQPFGDNHRRQSIAAIEQIALIAAAGVTAAIAGAFFPAGGQRDAAELGAMIERAIADALHAVGQHQTFQRGATGKCLLAHGFQGPGQRYGLQGSAIVKCLLGKFCSAISQRNTLQRLAGIEGHITQCRNVFHSGYRFQHAAIIKCRNADLRQRFRQVDLFHIVTFVECVIRQLSHALRNCNLLQRRASIENLALIVDTGARAIAAKAFRPAGAQLDLLQCAAPGEAGLAHCGHRIRQRHFRQFGTFLECVVTDALQAFRQLHRHDIIATIERIVGNACHTGLHPNSQNVFPLRIPGCAGF